MLYKFGVLFLILWSASVVKAQNNTLPWISVQGNSFVTSSGESIIFHGLNSSDPDKLEKSGHWNPEYFAQVKSWGANLVRFPVHPRAWRERGKNEYLKLLDEGIKMAAAEQLHVVIDWHSIGNLRSELFQSDGYITTKAETFEFWRTMAVQYGNNPAVAFFEFFNEPTTASGRFGVCSWKEWKEMMEELIVIVRANGAKNIPLIAGFNWAYDLMEVQADPIKFPGIAYVSHPYPQKRQRPWEPQWEKDWGFVSDQYPVILTEIGFCAATARGAHIPVISDPDYVEIMTSYCAKKGISYVVWVFDPNWSPMLIEDWTFKPTEAGAVWKEAMQKE
ncbi:MAG: cellulase family glycosylhydrolase [Saprospiraceae bacterium]|nr:cellulase family glycosylhydrolase [Saprospiraceae bacterium]